MISTRVAMSAAAVLVLRGLHQHTGHTHAAIGGALHRQLRCVDDDLLGPQSAGEVQAAAVASLARLATDDVPGLLLRPWPGYSPAVRTAERAAERKSTSTDGLWRDTSGPVRTETW